MTDTTTSNPIATLLGVGWASSPTILVMESGEKFELYRAAEGFCETLYRVNPGHGVGNPGFSLHLTPVEHHPRVLGNYLAGRDGVKRAEAEAITTSARKWLEHNR
jgi:hypothetical protein